MEHVLLPRSRRNLENFGRSELEDGVFPDTSSSSFKNRIGQFLRFVNGLFGIVKNINLNELKFPDTETTDALSTSADAYFSDIRSLLNSIESLLDQLIQKTTDRKGNVTERTIYLPLLKSSKPKLWKKNKRSKN